MKNNVKKSNEAGLALPNGSELTFQEHKERTASDCESIAKMLTDIAVEIREGNMKAFEEWWIEGGPEGGAAKIQIIRERIVLRYFYREEHVQCKKPNTKRSDT